MPAPALPRPGLAARSVPTRLQMTRLPLPTIATPVLLKEWMARPLAELPFEQRQRPASYGPVAAPEPSIAMSGTQSSSRSPSIAVPPSSRGGSSLCNAIVPPASPGAKVIVVGTPSRLAAAIASRSEPAPLSARVVTTMV